MNFDFSLWLALQLHADTCTCTGEECSPHFVHDGFSDICPDVLPSILSYDCNCQASVNLLSRFEGYVKSEKLGKVFGDGFARELPKLAKMRFTIPVVHLRGHKESCEYLFSSFYTLGGGHFYGEQAESIWAHTNEAGAKTRQMSTDHRHDALNAVFVEWNRRKMFRICE